MSRRGEMTELFRFNLYNIKTIKEKRKKRDAKREIRSASARKFFGALSPYYNRRKAGAKAIHVEVFCIHIQSSFVPRQLKNSPLKTIYILPI